MKHLREWLIRRVEFSIGGIAWPLIFTHRAIFLCQDLAGVELLNASITNPSARMLRALLFSALSVAGAPCSIEAVGRCLTKARIPAIQRLVFSAWAASMSEPEPEKEKEGDGEPVQLESWIEAWGRAREWHKLSDDEWLDMTPRQYAVLQKLRIEQMQREELLVGIIAATVQNFSMCRPDKSASAESFMLHKYPEKEPEPITGEYIMAAMARSRQRK